MVFRFSHLRAPGRKNPSNCNSHRIISVETLHMATKQGKRKNVLPARADTKSLLVRDIAIT